MVVAYQLYLYQGGGGSRSEFFFLKGEEPFILLQYTLFLRLTVEVQCCFKYIVHVQTISSSIVLGLLKAFLVYLLG